MRIRTPSTIVIAIALATTTWGQTAVALDSSPDSIRDTPFPLTVEDIPADFRFLPVVGKEDLSLPVAPSAEATSDGISSVFSRAPMVLNPSTKTAGTCQYKERSDNIHVTAGEASVHSWWQRVSTPASTCPSRANVEVWLQAYGCGSLGCGWVTVAHNDGDVYAGGGSSNWVNARHACANTNTVVYREQVDVDLIDWSDPSGYAQGPDTQIACYPA